MTSGIASYYTDAFLAKYFGDPETIFTPDQLIAYGVSASPIFEPGAQFNYSNTVLLGKVTAGSGIPANCLALTPRFTTTPPATLRLSFWSTATSLPETAPSRRP